jgi:meiotic recombination protein SPO11
MAAVSEAETDCARRHRSLASSCLQELLEEDFVKANPKWHHELQLMVKTKVKAEIQALSSFGFQYLSQEYLPRKLKEADWI